MYDLINRCKQCGETYAIEKGYNDVCCCNTCATIYDKRFILPLDYNDTKTDTVEKQTK